MTVADHIYTRVAMLKHRFSEMMMYFHTGASHWGYSTRTVVARIFTTKKQAAIVRSECPNHPPRVNVNSFMKTRNADA